MKRYFFYLFLCLAMMGCSSSAPTEPYGDETELAIQIAQLVEGENYNDVIVLLDKIVVKDNYSMKIVPFYEKDTFDMFADISPIVIYNEQGEWLSTNFEDDFWNYLQVENSQMGAWQAYLLSHNIKANLGPVQVIGRNGDLVLPHLDTRPQERKGLHMLVKRASTEITAAHTANAPHAKAPKARPQEICRGAHAAA